MVTKQTTKGLVKVSLWVKPKEASKIMKTQCADMPVGCGQGIIVYADSKN